MNVRPLHALLLAALFFLLLRCICGEEPFTRQEFDRFLSDARVVKQAAGKLKLGHFEAHGMLPAPELDRLVDEEARKIGWNVDRYNYIYARCVAYGAMVWAEREADKHDKNMGVIDEAMGGMLPEGAGFMSNIIRMQARILGERVKADIPVSERALLYDRVEEIMRIVLEPHILEAIPDVNS